MRIVTAFRCTFFLLFFPLIISAQEKQFSKAEILKDLTVFEKGLLEIHPGLNHYVTPETIQMMVENLRNKLPVAPTKRDLLFLLAPIIDTIHCGHTNLRVVHSNFIKKKFGKWEGFFPLALKEIDQRVLISGNFSRDTINLKPRLEILEINGESIDTLIHQISLINGGSDGFNTSGKRASALKFFANTYWLLNGETDTFQLKIRDLSVDTQFVVKIEGLSKKEIKKNVSNYPGEKKTGVIDLSFPDSLDNTAILSIRSFSAYDPWGIIYGGKLKRVFKTIKEKEVEKLIIDLRGNGGGAYINTKRLLRYTLNEPFVVIDEVSLNKNLFKSKAGWQNKFYFLFKKKRREKDKIRLLKVFQKQLKPKKKLNYSGKISLLIDKGTYSAASIYSAMIKTHRRGILIGEESGGAYFFSNAGLFKYLKLPHSKIVARIPVIRDEYAVDKTLQSLDRGVLPDVKVENTFEDYLNQTDVYLQKALDLSN